MWRWDDILLITAAMKKSVMGLRFIKRNALLKSLHIQRSFRPHSEPPDMSVSCQLLSAGNGHYMIAAIGGNKFCLG